MSYYIGFLISKAERGSHSTLDLRTTEILITANSMDQADELLKSLAVTTHSTASAVKPISADTFDAAQPMLQLKA